MYKQACALELTIPYREDANVKLLVSHDYCFGSFASWSGRREMKF